MLNVGWNLWEARRCSRDKHLNRLLITRTTLTDNGGVETWGRKVFLSPRQLLRGEVGLGEGGEGVWECVGVVCEHEVPPSPSHFIGYPSGGFWHRCRWGGEAGSVYDHLHQPSSPPPTLLSLSLPSRAPCGSPSRSRCCRRYTPTLLVRYGGSSNTFNSRSLCFISVFRGMPPSVSLNSRLVKKCDQYAHW